jgi:hypothetical protein
VFSLENAIKEKEEEERRKSVTEDVSFGDSCKKEGSIEKLASKVHGKEDRLVSWDGKEDHDQQESETGYFLYREENQS